MRRTLFAANLFLMLMLIFALQAQNHHNYGGNNQHQNNNYNHNQQNQHPQNQIREFTGVLVRNNNNNHHGYQNAAYGILVQAPNHQSRLLNLDDKGNRIVRDILRNHHRNNKKIVVKVKGYQDRHGTLNVVSMSRINKPNRFFANFDNHNHRYRNNNNWSFQLFVGLN